MCTRLNAAPEMIGGVKQRMERVQKYIAAIDDIAAIEPISVAN